MSGINLVINLLVESLGPAAKDMVKQWGLDLNIIDVGWPATSAIAFGSAVGALAIPIGLLVNLGMLLFGLTRTLNIDMWNLWHIAFTGALVTIMTDDFVLGVLTAIVHAILLLVLGDLSAKHISDYYGYQNITFPHGTSAPYYLIALPLEKLFNRIPGFRDWKADPETIQKRLGIFGESTVLGLILGILIGFLAGWEAEEVSGSRCEDRCGDAAAAADGRPADGGADSHFGGRGTVCPQALPGAGAVYRYGLRFGRRTSGGDRRLPDHGSDRVGDGGDRPRQPGPSLRRSGHHPLHRLHDGADLPGQCDSNGDRGHRFPWRSGCCWPTSIAPLFTTAAKNAGFDMPAGAAAVSSLVDGAVPTTAIFIFGAKLGYAGIIGIGALTLAAAYLLSRRRVAGRTKGSGDGGMIRR